MANKTLELHHGNTIVYDDLRITFHRAQRLPNKPHGKPSPDHGTLPLFPVSQHADMLSKDIAADGGILLGMSPTEGLYISFTSTKPYQIKLYLDETNSLTGQSLHPSQEIWYHHIERLETRRKWQNIDQGMKYRDYIVYPFQQQISGYVDPLGALCRFEPQTYTEEQMKDIKKALEVNMAAHPLRVKIAPYMTKGILSNPLEKAYRKFFAVRVKTPGGTVLFPSISAVNPVSYVYALLEERLGRHCMHEARLWVGNEAIAHETDRRSISSLPSENQTIDLRLESSLWCAPAQNPEECCDAPELIRRDPFPQDTLPNRTVSFKAYVLSEDVLGAIVGRPDVSCVSKRLEAQRGLHVWTKPAWLTDSSMYLPEVKR